MSQLTAKELRFADMAVNALADGPRQKAWKDWYSSILQEEFRVHGLFVVPPQIGKTILHAIQSEKRRMRAVIDGTDSDDSDVINDLEVFLHMEHELSLEAVS